MKLPEDPTEKKKEKGANQTICEQIDRFIQEFLDHQSKVIYEVKEETSANLPGLFLWQNWFRKHYIDKFPGDELITIIEHGKSCQICKARIQLAGEFKKIYGFSRLHPFHLMGQSPSDRENRKNRIYESLLAEGRKGRAEGVRKSIKVENEVSGKEITESEFANQQENQEASTQANRRNNEAKNRDITARTKASHQQRLSVRSPRRWVPIASVSLVVFLLMMVLQQNTRFNPDKGQSGSPLAKNLSTKDPVSKSVDMGQKQLANQQGAGQGVHKESLIVKITEASNQLAENFSQGDSSALLAQSLSLPNIPLKKFLETNRDQQSKKNKPDISVMNALQNVQSSIKVCMEPVSATTQRAWSLIQDLPIPRDLNSDRLPSMKK